MFPKMGKRKIEIAPISNDRARHVTFTKRSTGLLKKARELAILCKREVAVIAISESGQCLAYSSAGDIKATVRRYLELSEGEIPAKKPPQEEPHVETQPKARRRALVPGARE